MANIKVVALKSFTASDVTGAFHMHTDDIREMNECLAIPLLQAGLVDYWFEEKKKPASKKEARAEDK